MIEVLTEQTSTVYRTYLRKRGVSYILAGSELLDSRQAIDWILEYLNTHKE